MAQTRTRMPNNTQFPPANTANGSYPQQTANVPQGLPRNQTPPGTSNSSGQPLQGAGAQVTHVNLANPETVAAHSS